MSIKFACKCGKRLRAGDTMAGRHTLCPACGALVAIPKESVSPGAAPALPRPPSDSLSGRSPGEEEGQEIGPILVRVRRRNDKDPNQHRRSVWVPLDPESGPPPEKLPRPVRNTRRRYNWELEKHWYQSLAYPFRAWRLLTLLGTAQAGLLAWAAVIVPKLADDAGEALGLDLALFVLASLAVGAYTVGFFDCVLSSAAEGEYRVVRVPGIDLGIPGAASWFACFLAGPVVAALALYWYWQDCGDPDLLDQVILAELAGGTLGYWLLAVLAAREAGAWFAGPAGVASLMGRLGPKTLLAAAGIPAFAYFALRMMVAGIVRWHVDGLFGLPVLAFAVVAAMFGATFLLRLLGVWAYRLRPARPEGPPEIPADLRPGRSEAVTTPNG